MERHAFPADLADDVAARWGTRVLGVFRRPPLPSREQLRHLLEVAYLASQETDEARPIRFTLCCTPVIDAVRRFQQDTEVQAWNFEAPRAFDVQELRRLAVTTDIDGGAIWVQVPDAPSDPPRIRGLLNLGQSWAHARDAFAFHYDALPDALTIRVDGPGALSVFQGQLAVASLVGGKLRESRFAQESLHGIQPLLEEGQAHFADRIEGPRHAPDRLVREFEWTAYVNVLMALLNAIRQRGHGGAVVLAGRNSRVAAPDTRLIRMKYRLENPAPHLADHYIQLVNKRCALADLQWRLEEADEAYRKALEPTVPPLNDLRLAYAEVRDANQALAEACAFVGQLAGTDGAIVLRTDLSLLGFGTEIVLEEAAPAPVYEVQGLALSRAELLDSEQFGMRHRSAMRLCAASPDVAAFVISQDGGASLTFHHQGRVFVRRNISTTNAGMVFS
ncbi:hypothetical protein D3C72_496690 [compost metagenome]